MDNTINMIPEVAEKGWPIYDLNGNEIYNGNDCRTILPHAGIYLLKTDKYIGKISVR